MEKLEQYRKECAGKSPQELLGWVLKTFGREHIAIASSLGAEDQVLTDMALAVDPAFPVFTLDTGRLPQETYDLIERTMKKYRMRFEILFPDRAAVERMEGEKGPNLFYESVENRKLCCGVRKVESLKRKLGTLKAWVCGLRRAQAVTRGGVEQVDWDAAFGIYKISPLAAWSEEEVWSYIKEHQVPYNALHDKGYSSIGCGPCTRAIKPGEDVRAGRWWWEAPEHKECGLHKRPQK